MNALSWPTWVIHISSIVEWALAIWLIWRYSEVSGERSWRWLAWGMFPALVGAMAVVTWHYFDNIPELEFLGLVQALMTVLGNTTLAIAAIAIYREGHPKKS